ncbi:hypothetical protein Q0Z83_041830 [Actinoplanes sichuanensis]|uniref:Uncharacterized protein n=1 Tax=Actinoplanes sichuanensis TaxID=512349 RepID=A0ABW4AJI6_9ACTN|nr:hypothetical protein [Actinoplanes sichuanensis]BEL05992.1 hypothetical protein Q0Z83_041830 [Actinoplanes sichuanensis]
MPAITPSNGLPAAQRTDLLRRMSTLRGATARTVRPVPLLIPGNEAVLTGVLAVLGPLDTMISTLRPPVFAGSTAGDSADASVTVTFGSSAARHRPGSMSVLVSGRRGVPPAGGAAVDVWDVEAILTTTARFASSVRAGGSALLIRLCGTMPPSRRDPIAVLAGRMYAAQQLDASGMQAITAGHDLGGPGPDRHGCALCRAARRRHVEDVRACPRHFVEALIADHAAPLRARARQMTHTGTSRP